MRQFVFAFFTWFIIFIFYAFLGWCFEMVHMSITTKEVVNRGFWNGPIIPIYGVGMIIIIALLSNHKSSPLILIFGITLICSILEYAISYFLEKIYSVRLWDYTDKKFNLHGRICVETMSLFIIMAMGVMYFIHPVFIDHLRLLPKSSINILGSMLLTLLYQISNEKSLHYQKKCEKSIICQKNVAK